MAIETNIPVHRWVHYSGEFKETAVPIRRVQWNGGTRGIAKRVRINRLWRVEWWNPEDCGDSWEWESV